MRKILTIVLILSLLILITACDDEEIITGDTPFVGGSQGLIAEFEPMGVEASGAYSIYQDETFPIQIILKNKGEQDISVNDVKVKIYGILLSDFSGLPNGELTNIDNIEKISDINPEGEEIIINFGSDIKYKPTVTGSYYDANIFASYTYKYKTTALVPNVCFSEDFRDTEVCNVDERKTVHSSGAPVQVKSVTEKPAGSGVISLEFEIQNVGGGEITIPGEEFPLRYGKLAYQITPNPEMWSCSAAGSGNQARLTDGIVTIRCKLTTPLPEGTKYTKPIGLELTYDYRDIIQETLRINKAE